MTLAYWCVLLAMFLPWLCAYYSKKVGGFSGNDNHYPRDFLGSTQGEAKRADAAQKNSFEIFPAFAAAVLIAHANRHQLVGHFVCVQPLDLHRFIHQRHAELSLIGVVRRIGVHLGIVYCGNLSK